MRSLRWFAWKGVAPAALALCLAACAASPAYYWQAAGGQLEIWRRATPVQDVIAAPATPAALRERLQDVEAVRSFASSALGLPDNDSYRRYADLKRPAVVWNVVAAPALSLQTKTWCFWVSGCVGYLGYFSEAGAKKYAQQLHAAGMDVYVGEVPAYSTLGWFSDPLLNTFINWPEPELAGLIFHELAHQLIYAPGDTEFNESFATCVQEAGTQRWLAKQGKTAPDEARAEAMQRDFQRLVGKYRDQLAALYAGSATDADKLARKAALLQALHGEYVQMRDKEWGGYRGYDNWFDHDLNNAKLASVGYYHGLLPAFRALLAAEGGDLPRFYARVRELVKLSPEARRTALAVVPAQASAVALSPPG